MKNTNTTLRGLSQFFERRWLFLWLFLMVGNSLYAINYTSNVASGNWNTSTTWSPNGIPGSADNVTILGGHTITVIVNGAVNSLTIDATGALQINSTFTFDINGAFLNNGIFTVGTSCVININSTLTNTTSGSISDAGSTYNFNGNIVSAGSFLLNANGTIYNFVNTLSITPNASMVFGSNAGGSGSISATRTVTINNGVSPSPIGLMNTLNISGTLINNLQGNTLTVNNMSGSGTFNNGINAVYRHGASAAPTVTNFDCTAVGNLVYYDSGSAQTIRGTTYHNLTLGNLATKSLGGAITTNGTLFVGGGTTFNMGGFIVTALGDVTFNGNITAGSSTLSLQGSTNTNFTYSNASALSLYFLTINKALATNIVSVVSNQNITISQTLTLTQGKLQIENFNLILSNGTPGSQLSIGSINSYIITNGTGNLTRNGLPTGTYYPFPVGNATHSSQASLTTNSTVAVSVRYSVGLPSSPPTSLYDADAGTHIINSTTGITLKLNNSASTSNNAKFYQYNYGTTTWTTTQLPTNFLGTNQYEMSASQPSNNMGYATFAVLDAPVAQTSNGNLSNFFNANWTAVPGANKYFFDLATTSDFSSGILFNNIDVGNNMGVPVSGLTPNTVYFYRVRANNTTFSVTSANSNVKMTSTYIGVGAGNNVNTSGGTITYPSGSALDNISFGLTLEMWITTPTTSGTIMSKKNGTTSGWQLDYDATNKNFTFTTYSSGANSITTLANSALPNTLMHFACLHLTNSSTILLNGQSVISGSTLATLGTTNPLIINPPTGTKLDELRIWGTLVLQSDIHQYMCKKMSGTHPNIANLLVYMPFDEGTQITATKYVENKAPNAIADATYTTGISVGLSVAPIGDISIAGTSSANITLNDTTPFIDAFTLSNITGSPSSHHIYKIKAQPNVLTPPSNYLGIYNGQYYGVFFVGGTNPQGTISYSYNQNPNIANGNALRFARRNDAVTGAGAWSKYGGIINRQNKTLNRMRATAGEYILATRNAVMSNARDAGTGLALTSSQYADITRPVQDDFTIEFWVKANGSGMGSVARDGRRIIGTNSPVNTQNFEITYNGTNRLNFVIGDGTADVSITSNPITIGEWYHVAVTRGLSTKSMEMYINGTLVASNYSNNNTAILNAISSLSFGNTLSTFFNGTIDEVKFWNTTLTGNTIKDWMNLRANSDHPNFNNLVAYYRCDDATGTFAEDLANGQEAILNNSNMWVTGTQPLGDGASVRLPATSGNGVTYTNYTAAGCSIILPATGPYPNGDLVVTRLDTAPESYPNVPGMSFISSYWVIRNYGTNLTFNKLTEIKFEVPAGNTISALDISNPNNVKLYKRPDNAVGSGTWNFVQGATGFGSVRFGGPTTIEDFSQFVIGSITSPLGVSWVNFEGQRTQTQEVTLRWNTATETKNIGFEVQRSKEGVNFEKIAFVDGGGTSNQNRTYNYKDKESTQAYYYRLRQVDVDGDANFSKVLYINAETQDEILKIFPNPTTSEIQLQTKTEWAKDDNLRIVIHNVEGKKIWEGKGNLLDLQENINLQLKNWKSGTYILKLQTSDKVLQSKFVKQ
jgi:hypothetical protein